MAAKPTSDKFLEGIELGMVPIQAAGYAGYKHADKSARDLLARPEIKEQFDLIKEKIREESKITRAKIEEGILDAIHIARIQADPLGMIRGYGELNKMQGNYAPEKRKIEITAKQKRLATQFEELSEQQLLEMVAESGDELIIEAEYEDVTDEEASNA